MKKAKPVLIVVLLVCFVALVGYALLNVNVPLPRLDPIQRGEPYRIDPPGQTEPDGGVLGSPEQGW